MTPPAGYEISNAHSRIDCAVVHRFLAEESYWARGRERATVERSIEASRCYGVYRDREMVAFARAVTDGETFAWLADVFVVREHRGRGIGKWLVESVLNDPTLEHVGRWMLGTADAHELYRRFGFREVEAGRFMTRG
jgi:GNAT superfamily N-acetyltransferase